MSKVVIVTGASAGIGKATALKLIEEGHTVYGAARNIDKMQDIIQKGGHALKMDITQENDVTNVIDTVIKNEGRIDVLVNNAGYGLYGAVEDIDLDRARYQFEVNLFGLARITQLALPHMREQKSGKIINISSIGGKIYTPLGAWYHSTKHALEGWSDCLRNEVKQFGIDVVIIEPGLIKTEFLDITTNQISETANSQPYKTLYNAFNKQTQQMNDRNLGSSPSVIAQVISKSIRAQNPRTRYAAGFGSFPLLLLRWLLPDRTFDWMLRFLA